MATSGNPPPEFLPSLISGQYGFPNTVLHQMHLGRDLQTTPNYFPTVQSGYVIGSGVISSLTWDDITSVATGRDNLYCALCNISLWDNQVRVTGLSGLVIDFCHKCAGYDPKKGGFGWQREEWIRSTYAFSKDTPAGIIADYLEDHGRTKDAEYLRRRMNK